MGGKKAPALANRISNRKESKDTIFYRAVDRSLCSQCFDDDDYSQDVGLKVWFDIDILTSKVLRGMEWVLISIVRPAGLASHIDPQKMRDAESNEGGKPALKIVAKAVAWDGAPDARHVSLSSALSSALGCSGIVGVLVRVEAAPQRSSSGAIKFLKVFPFKTGELRGTEGLRFGRDLKTNRQANVEKMRDYYSTNGHNLTGILDGPLTDGLVLLHSKEGEHKESWDGVLIRFDPPSLGGREIENRPFRWVLGHEVKIGIKFQQEIPNPLQSFGLEPIQTNFPLNEMMPMIGVRDLIDKLFSHLLRSSSVLLTGGLGSGKTSLACLAVHKLRSIYFFHAGFFSCREEVTDETHISTIKDSLHRLLMTASWGTRFGSRAVVILDDLDRLCPAETELQVGGNNDRSRQISELICSMVRQYCGANSGIMLLATAQSKESVNNVIVGGHVVREIISLKAPNKDCRRRVLEGLVGGKHDEAVTSNGFGGRNDIEGARCHDDEAAWMADDIQSESSRGPESFEVDANIDFLDLAGRIDGYMPGDLVLLVARARSEALIRSVNENLDSTAETRPMLTKEDFQRALEGFTPASLRNVTLQSSTTTFDSIGGLHETRKILLETLQYPTTYAPIFAQCPLRLRSGLLLYGYPGCGKTLLASAVAGECGLNFISVKGPEILNKYIGASEKSVRDLFERAEAARPCILFFDEFDSIAPKRGHDSTGVTDRVVNQLLTQMDGAEGLSGVYVLAATSRPDLIDPALLRPGRLDKSLICDLPDLNDRLDILQALSKKLRLSPDVLNNVNPQESLHEIALRTEGYSGADLQAVIYNAHLEAIQCFLGSQDNKPSYGTAGRHQQHKKHDDRNSSCTMKILSFRYGAEEEEEEVHLNGHAPPSSSSSSSPQGKKTDLIPRYQSVLEELDAIKKTKRRNSHLPPSRDGTHRLDNSNGNNNNNWSQKNGEEAPNDKSAEVTIQWEDIEASLASTRNSISADERRRLARIYREFLIGRNGEMRSGQGPTEVGGRSTLM